LGTIANAKYRDLYSQFFACLSLSWVFEDTAYLLTIGKHFDKKILISLDIMCNRRNRINHRIQKTGGISMPMMTAEQYEESLRGLNPPVTGR